MSSTAAAMLQLDRVSKHFGALRAVDAVSLCVERGSITGLIGPNGAGKTTLFNTIAGALAPDAGTITLDGEPITGLRADQVFHRGLARTFQIPRPLPTLTVMENLLLAPIGQTGERVWAAWLQRSRIRAEEIAHRGKAREVLQFTGLAHIAERSARELSGGQRKLLELARVLMVDPRVILLDEPAAGVHPSLLAGLVERIVELQRSGITFVLIEHHIDLVMQLCDPVVVMAGGRVIAQGRPEAVRRDARVAEAYLGDAA